MPNSPQKDTKNDSLDMRIERLFEQAYTYAQGMHRSDLVSDISRLWQVLTVNRAESLADYFKNPALRRAYIGYYMPLYAAKMALLMQQMIGERHINLPNRPIRVLDLGSGPLVGIFAARLALGQIGQATAVDREIGPMRFGYDFLKQLSSPNETLNVQLLRANLNGPPQFWRPHNPPDLIIMSHVLNEFGGSRRALPQKLRLILSALNMLEQGGRMLVVEPANRVNTRELMALRDELFEDKSVTIFAPCTGAVECPLLDTKDSWCHGELSWKRPALCEKIDKKIGFDKSFLKYSYLLVGQKEKHLPPAPQDTWRVVSGPMHHEGIIRRYVCTRSGLLTLSQSEKNKNQPLATLFRGQLIKPSDMPDNIVKVVRES